MGGVGQDLPCQYQEVVEAKNPLLSSSRRRPDRATPDHLDESIEDLVYEAFSFGTQVGGDSLESGTDIADLNAVAPVRLITGVTDSLDRFQVSEFGDDLGVVEGDFLEPVGEGLDAPEPHDHRIVGHVTEGVEFEDRP